MQWQTFPLYDISANHAKIALPIDLGSWRFRFSRPKFSTWKGKRHQKKTRVKKDNRSAIKRGGFLSENDPQSNKSDVCQLNFISRLILLHVINAAFSGGSFSQLALRWWWRRMDGLGGEDQRGLPTPGGLWIFGFRVRIPGIVCQARKLNAWKSLLLLMWFNTTISSPGSMSNVHGLLYSLCYLD